jgi:hypothetical protein
MSPFGRISLGQERSLTAFSSYLSDLKETFHGRLGVDKFSELGNQVILTRC